MSKQSKSPMKGKGVSTHGVEAGHGLPFGKTSVRGPNGEMHDAQGPKDYTEDERHGVYGGHQWKAPAHTHGFSHEIEHDNHQNGAIGGGVARFWKGHGDESSCEDHLDGSASSEPTRPWDE
jgi:hypothetical protein